MTKKQIWLKQRLLIPAGILPPAIKYKDLKYNEQNRTNIGNIGFEYFLLRNQNSQEINNSAIGGKIYALHAPWPGKLVLPGVLGNPLFTKIMHHILYPKGAKITDEFKEMSDISFKFAHEIGAKVVTVHIGFFNHKKLREELAHLANLEKKYKVIAAIEHDPNLTLRNPRGTNFLEVNGSQNWITKPIEILSVIDKIYPQHKFNLTFDTAAIIGKGENLIETIKPIIKRVAHVHLANDETGEELATEVNRMDIVEVVNLLYENNYKGYITAEVNGVIGSKEDIISKIYGASSVIGLKILKETTFKNAQAHIENSCKYLIKNI